MTKTASFVSCHRQTMLLARKTGEEQLSEECLTSAIIIIMMLVVIITTITKTVELYLFTMIIFVAMTKAPIIRLVCLWTHYKSLAKNSAALNRDAAEIEQLCAKQMGLETLTAHPDG